MSFSNYLNGKTTQKIDEAISPELRAEYDKVSDKIKKIAEDIKKKLSKTPVKFDEKRNIIKIGLDSFEDKNLPSFSVYKDTFDKSLVIKQSTNDFTAESATKYAAMLEEVSKNAKFLEEALTEYDELKNELYSINAKAIEQNKG